MIQDIRIAFRSLTKTLGFTATALLTLGIGIGADTVVFSPRRGSIPRPPCGKIELVLSLEADETSPADRLFHCVRTLGRS